MSTILREKEEKLNGMAIDQLISFLDMDDTKVLSVAKEVLQTYFMKTRIAISLRREDGIRKRSAISVIRTIMPLLSEEDRKRYVDLLRASMPREYQALPEIKAKA